jgi:antitoxin component YwqK of YwqJK toxin-antitoxin module
MKVAVLIFFLILFEVKSYGQNFKVQLSDFALNAIEFSPYSHEDFEFLKTFKDGEYVFYFDSLKKEKALTGRIYNSKKVGIWNLYFPNGHLKKTFEYDENSLLDGNCFWYYENGVKKFESLFCKNMQNGPFKEYFTNSNVRIEGNYSDDLEDGEFKTYDSTGQLVTWERYECGEHVDSIIDYYNSGQIESIQYLSQLDKCRLRNKSGKLTFQNDTMEIVSHADPLLPIPFQYKFFENGKVDQSICVESCDTLIETFFPDGCMKMQGKISFGEVDFLKLRKQKQISESQFSEIRNRLLIGVEEQEPYVQLLKSELIQSTLRFFFNGYYPVGVWIYFDETGKITSTKKYYEGIEVK